MMDKILREADANNCWSFKEIEIKPNVTIGASAEIVEIDQNTESTLFIGENSIIEEGTVISGKYVYIGADVHIGKNCRIRGEYVHIDSNCLIFDDVCIVVQEKFDLGGRSKISKGCVFRCNNISIGKELWCNENVDIGGGGCWQSSARLEIGDFVHIGKNAMINVCQLVHIGSCTGIGIESMIFTHSAGNGQSVLNGYQHIEKPVWIGDNVSLYTRAFVTPGTRINNGAIVGALSYATGNLEKGLYVGTPAKMKRAIVEPDDDIKIEILQNAICREMGDIATIICDNKVVIKGMNKVIIILSKYVESIFERILYEMNSKYEEIVVILMNGIYNEICDKKNATYISIEEEKIAGKTTILSEKVRDCMRREGIILSYDGYRPMLLDYYGLIKRGIER